MFLMSREFKTFNISIPVDFMEEIDQYAENIGVNRLNAINMLIRIGLDQENDMSIIHQLIDRVLELERYTRLGLLNRVSELQERLSVYEEEF